ncbi:uncharacterized protein LOC112491998 [Ziziphus jujuba]|uniref:Uncharacterized protein LOC112491998 n=1 Tax=Ziziphus jujuba TaxID=326968 RepID=A0A6P6G8L8_ZIZJJ|nr:uncharacterized protein LOC112491998 [Ziziphus jujuba]
MADQSGFMVPHHYSYDGPYNDDILSLMDDNIPFLADLPVPLDGPSINPHSMPAFNDIGIQQVEHPSDWNFPNEFNSGGGVGGGSEAGPSKVRCEMGNPNLPDNNLETPNPSDAYNYTKPLSIWPVPPVPFNCSCCQVLREIIHVHGDKIMKLEIHGRLGMICHAVFQNQSVDVNSSGNNRWEMFDFCKKSIEDVKHFLVQYCIQRKLEGYTMQQDPLSFFYEAVCVGLEWDEITNIDDLILTSPVNSGVARMQQPEEAGQPEVGIEAERNPRSLAEQRQRTGRLTLMDLKEYLHLPIEEAARRMNVCPTVVKKICRRNGLTRWPHRKIKSIRKQISNLLPSLHSEDARTRINAQTEINRLQQQVTNICAGVSIALL